MLCSYPTTTSWPFCRPRPSTLKITPFSIRGRGFVKVILAAISLPTTASPKGCRRVIQKKSGGVTQTYPHMNNVPRSKSKNADTKNEKKSETYFDGKVRCTEPEGGLVGQYLLGLTDSSGQGQHQSGLVHQLVLVLLVRQDPLNGLLCLKKIQAHYQAYLSAGLSVSFVVLLAFELSIETKKQAVLFFRTPTRTVKDK